MARPRWSICCSVFVHHLDEGHADWQTARQLFRIERVAATDEQIIVGNRYFVASMSAETMSAEHAYLLACGHWRCENEGHWSADAVWEEDATRTPWATHPQGVLAVGLLCAIAINIQSVLRALS